MACDLILQIRSLHSSPLTKKLSPLSLLIEATYAYKETDAHAFVI